MTALQQYARDPYIDIDRFFQGRECREWCGGKRWRRHSGSNTWANSVRVLSVKMISVISRQTTEDNVRPQPLGTVDGSNQYIDVDQLVEGAGLCCSMTLPNDFSPLLPPLKLFFLPLSSLLVFLCTKNIHTQVRARLLSEGSSRMQEHILDERICHRKSHVGKSPHEDARLIGKILCETASGKYQLFGFFSAFRLFDSYGLVLVQKSLWQVS